MLSSEEWQAISLSVQLAFNVVVLLLIGATPLAWWLSQRNHFVSRCVSAIVALPLVLPPTVIGFYFLIAFGPQGPIGSFTEYAGIASFAFSYKGLVLASMVYSLPFVVQPLQNAFQSIDRIQLDAATMLGAGPIDRFFNLVIPLAKSGFVSAFILGFAHTIGEFGVVLMIGGSMPGETKVVSIQIYEHVESLQYARAHLLSALMLVFSFVVLLAVYGRGRHTNISAS
ncbi:MAG: molybdate ABC transporter permease subunit [Agarilytica sp.]